MGVVPTVEVMAGAAGIADALTEVIGPVVVKMFPEPGVQLTTAQAAKLAELAKSGLAMEAFVQGVNAEAEAIVAGKVVV